MAHILVSISLGLANFENVTWIGHDNPQKCLGLSRIYYSQLLIIYWELPIMFIYEVFQVDWY